MSNYLPFGIAVGRERCVGLMMTLVFSALFPHMKGTTYNGWQEVGFSEPFKWGGG